MRGLEQRLRVAVGGEQRSRVPQAGVQVPATESFYATASISSRCRERRPAMSAVHSGLRQVSDREAAKRQVVGRIGWVVHPAQAARTPRHSARRRARPARGRAARSPAPGGRRRAGRLLGLGGEGVDAVLFPPQRGEHGLGHPRRGVHDRLHRLARQPAGLLGGRNGRHSGHPGAPRSTPVPQGTAPGGRAGRANEARRSRWRRNPPARSKAPTRIAASARRAALLVRIRVRRQPAQLVDDDRAALDRCSEGEDREQPPVACVDGQPLGRGHDAVPRGLARLGPEAPQGRAPQELQRKTDVAIGRDPLGEFGQRSCPAADIADAVVESLPDPHHPGSLSLGQVKRGGLAKQPDDEVMSS